tara:strand:- start:269 stop:457 length:189 start_codon:yes stop_codon:yes gene_type:complete
MTDFNYETGEYDFGYEISGATGEEYEHKDGCDWVYGNCTCGMADQLHTLMMKESDEYDEGEW